MTDRGSVVLRGQSEPVGSTRCEGEAGAGRPRRPRGRRSTGPLVGRDAGASRGSARCCDGARRPAGAARSLVVGEAGHRQDPAPRRARGRRPRARLRLDLDREHVLRRRPSRTASPALFAQAVADEHGGRFRDASRGRCCSPRTSTPRTSAGSAARSRRSPATPPSPAGRPRRPDMPADPAAVTATLLEVAGRYIDRIIETAGPRVVVIDDLHWMDPSSAGMVEVLVERAARTPIVVLAGMRPGAAAGWANGAGVERLDLGGLAMPETAQLATQVARAALDADGARRIHERTAGNPLFVAETVRAFLEDGTLAWRRRPGRRSPDAPLTGLPVTLRAVLGARIDALRRRRPRGPRRRLGHRRRASRPSGWSRPARRAAARTTPSTASLEAGLDRPRRRRGVAVRPPAHPRRRLCRPAREPAAGRSTRGSRTASRRPGTRCSSSLIAVHRAASGDAARAIPLLRGGRGRGARARGRRGGRGVLADRGRAVARTPPRPSTTGRGRRRRSRRPAAR